MKAKRCKITVTLDETSARWARIEGARRETSDSRFLGKILEERMLAQDAYGKALRRGLAREPFLGRPAGISPGVPRITATVRVDTPWL